jgi:hypothetical protein
MAITNRSAHIPTLRDANAALMMEVKARHAMHTETMTQQTSQEVRIAALEARIELLGLQINKTKVGEIT